MKTEVTTLSSWKKQVDIEVSEDEIRPHLEKAYRSYQKKIHVDGFRKGKVPLSIIQKRYGDAIQAEVADDLIQVFFKKAVEDENIPIVSPASIKDITFEEGQPFSFSAEVEVKPEIEVKDYKGFKVEKEILKVTDEDLQSTMEVLQEQRAERKPVEGGARKGDIVSGDVQALDATGVPIIGQKWEDRAFELGKAPLGDLVEHQLLGVTAGDERRFEVSQSEPTPDGKTQERVDRYSIRVKGVDEKILPDLNDAFARELGEFETVDELKEDIRKRLEGQREDEAERLLRNRIADEVVKRNDFEVPPSMVQNALDGLWEDFQKRPDGDIEEKEFREQNRPSVVWNLKWHVLWQEIGKAEGISVQDSDLDAEIDRMAKASEKEEKKIRAWFKDADRRERLRDRLLEDGVIQFLKENIKIKEVVLKKPKQTSSSLITQ